VRLSDHLPSSKNITDLFIFIPKNSKKQYIVALKGKLYIHNSYTSLRVFLENWALVADVFTTNEAFKLNMQESLEITILQQRNEMRKMKKILDTSLLNFNSFTPKQRVVIEEFIKQNTLDKPLIG